MSRKNNLNARIQKMTDEKIQKLAKDPTNIVYDYKRPDPLPPSDVVPLDEVKGKVQRLYSEYLKLRRQIPPVAITHHQNETFKLQLLRNQEWALFSETHPNMFDMIVHPNVNQNRINMLYRLIEMKHNNASVQQVAATICAHQKSKRSSG